MVIQSCYEIALSGTWTKLFQIIFVSFVIVWSAAVTVFYILQYFKEILFKIFPILATNNDGIQHDRQPTHSNYFWSFFFHKDFSKKSGERWTLWVFFSLIILSLILFGVIGSDFFSYLALKVISSTRPVGNFCASLMGSEICSDECYAKKL